MYILLNQIACMLCHKMCHIATDVVHSVVCVLVCLCVCMYWTRGWAVQTQLNRSRCRLGADSSVVHCLPATMCEWMNAFANARGEMMVMWPLT